MRSADALACTLVPRAIFSTPLWLLAFLAVRQIRSFLRGIGSLLFRLSGMAFAGQGRGGNMADFSTGIQRHYGSTAIVQRVLNAVADSDQDASRLTAEMLYPYDQFHGRGLVATRENAAKLNLDASMRVLDV